MKHLMIIHPEGNINNNPNLKGIVKILCEEGYKVDIYSPGIGSIDQSSPCPGANFVLIDQSKTEFPITAVIPLEAFKNDSVLDYIKFNIPRYDLVIGVDRGIIEASLIAKFHQIPYGMISYEIIFSEEAGSQYLVNDIEASKDVSFAVCQDKLRSFHLSEENHIPLSKIIDIPVAGRSARRGVRAYNLHEILGIPRQKKIALYMGSVTAKWSGINEIIEGVDRWPDDWVLLLHQRYSRYEEDILREVSKKKNIFVSPFSSLPFSRIGELIDAVDLGLGIYIPQKSSIFEGNNLKYIGMASGKIMTYLQYGLPILINELGEMSTHTRENKLGTVVKNLSEIPSALASLNRDVLSVQRENCFSFFASELDLDKRIQPLLSVIHKVTNLKNQERGNHVRKKINYSKNGPESGIIDNMEGLSAKTKEKYPKITVVTPSFNQGEFLEECIQSVLSQNYPNLEYIIMDGGSTDNSINIIKKYKKHLHYWQSKSDGGQYSAINEGFKLSSGEIMTWLNSDDKFHAGAFDIAANIFAERSDVDWLMGKPNGIAADGGQTWVFDYLPLWSRAKYLAKIYKNPYIQQEGTFWRRRLWDKAGAFVSTSYSLAGDLELWTRFFRSTQLHTVDALLAGFRQHEGQKTAQNILLYNQEAEAILDLEYQFYNKSIDKPLNPAPAPILLDENKMPIAPDPVPKMNLEIENNLKLLEQAVLIGNSLEAKTQVLKLLGNETSRINILNSLNDKNLEKKYSLSMDLLYGIFFNKRISGTNGINIALQDQNAIKVKMTGINGKENSELYPFLISAVVSVYNSERFIKGCLDDLINQTLFGKGQLEIVIVNTGSQQNEEKIIKEYQDKYSNIKYIKTEQRETVYQAWNRGIKAASGKYVTNANTDDRHRADALEVMANELDSNPKIALVYGNQFVTRNENETFENHTAYGAFLWPEFDRIQLLHTSCCGPQPMWRKSLHDELGYFLNDSKVAGDYEWWLRISEKYDFKHIDQFLGLYLLSENSIEHQETAACELETGQIRAFYAKKAGLENWDYRTYKPTFLVLNSSNCHPELKEALPLVSVIIPTFNRPEFLRESIQSVLNQTYRNFEIVVVNDAGKDVKKLIDEIGDERLRYVNHEKNKGLAAARNTGIRNSKGKYIAFLDDDDLFYPQHLSVALSHLNDKIKVVYTDAVRAALKRNGEKYQLIEKRVPYSIDFRREKLFVGNITPVNCVVFEKELTFSCGLLDEKLTVLEDWDFWIRLSKYSDFKHIPQSTVQVNWRTDGSTLTSSRQKDFAIFRKLLYERYAAEISQISDLEKIQKELFEIWKEDGNVLKPLISIIILTFNGLNYNKECLESIIKYTDSNYEIIIVDNSSSDGTVEYIKEFAQRHPNVKLILNETNAGFPAAVNQGIKESQGRYCLIANNDIVVTKNWISRMLEIAESDYYNGIVGCISNSVSGVQIDKKAKYKNISEMHKYANKVWKQNSGKTLKFPRVAFLCTLIKKEVIDTIGGLDERFTPGNFEDDDFCLRAQLAGYKTIIAQDVFIHHYGSKSFKADGEQKYFERLNINKEKFIDKWGGDSDEIWLKGKTVKKRNLKFPINKNELSEKFERALVYLEDREFDFAMDSLKDAISIFRCSEIKDDRISFTDLLNLAGNTAIILEDYDSAKEYFEEELKLAPDSSEACRGLGEVFFALEIYDASKTMFEWAVKNDPKSKMAASGLAKINTQLGLSEKDNSLFENSASELTGEIQFNNDGENSMEISNAAEFKQYFDEAFNLYQSKQYKDSLIKLYEAENYYSDSNNSAGINLVDLNVLRGTIYLLLEDLNNSRVSFEKALNLDPASSEACSGLGEILFRTGLIQEAKTMFEWAVQNDPNSSGAKNRLAKANRELGLHDDHSTLAGGSSVENEAQILVDEAYELFQNKQHGEALSKLLLAEDMLEEIESDSKRTELSAGIFNFKGFNYLALNKLDKAKQNFEQALSLNPESSQACAGLGEIFYLSEKDQEAKTMYEWAVKNDPQNPFALSGLLKINKILGLPESHNSLISE